MVEIAPSCSSECCEEVDIVSSSSSDSNQTCKTHPSRHTPSDDGTGVGGGGIGPPARESESKALSLNPIPH